MPMSARILIVDDEPDVVENSVRILEPCGHRCSTATEARRALDLLETEHPDLLLTDLKMPGIDGMALLHRAHELDPPIPVIMMTAFATIESAVEAVKEGAFDYLPKDCSVQQLRMAVDRALRHRGLQVENANLRNQLQQVLGFENIIGTSPAITRVFELVKKAARSEANILVVGESGTGKELIARAVHANSPRAAQAFVPVDCASLPEQLLESELFGHEKGAFTGAVRSKPGLMEVAHRGTLFLDEIAEMVPVTQVKLLRVLQERKFRRLGGRVEQEVDVRVLAATNMNPVEAIRAGKLRDDLYYRLNVFTIELPPLRDRKEDLPLLLQAFLDEFNLRDRRQIRAVSPEALRLLELYDWPGNIRELRNVMERATILARGEFIEPQHLPRFGAPVRAQEAVPSNAVTISPGMTVDEAERRLILATLEAAGGNKTRAAEMLGISLKTLHNKLNRMKLTTSS
jgi:DNA-binding NtrC family response regulator